MARKFETEEEKIERLKKAGKTDKQIENILAADANRAKVARAKLVDKLGKDTPDIDIFAKALYHMHIGSQLDVLGIFMESETELTLADWIDEWILNDMAAYEESLNKAMDVVVEKVVKESTKEAFDSQNVTGPAKLPSELNPYKEIEEKQVIAAKPVPPKKVIYARGVNEEKTEIRQLTLGNGMVIQARIFTDESIERGNKDNEAEPKDVIRAKSVTYL